MRVRSASEKRDEDASAKYTNIEPNEANYIYVFQKPTCLKGFLKNKDEKLFISFYSNQRSIIDNLTITSKLNDKESKAVTDMVGNVMSLNFP